MVALNNIRKYFVEYFSLNDYLISQVWPKTPYAKV